MRACLYFMYVYIYTHMKITLQSRTTTREIFPARPPHARRVEHMAIWEWPLVTATAKGLQSKVKRKKKISELNKLGKGFISSTCLQQTLHSLARLSIFLMAILTYSWTRNNRILYQTNGSFHEFQHQSPNNVPSCAHLSNELGQGKATGFSTWNQDDGFAA